MSLSNISNPRQTFKNPTIPFAGTILGGLQPGEMVVIQGSVPSDADRFQVDFTCGSSVKPRADVAFHLNPRFSRSPCIVCNTLQKERWGREEILQATPFRPGHAFEIVILILKDCYKVAVNGAHVLEYTHRVDLDRVDTLCVSGKVHVEAVGVLSSSSLAAPVAGPTRQNSEGNTIISSSGDLNVPFSAQLLKGLSVGSSIVIKGQTHPNADSFCVNLRVSGGGDVALHLNPRLNTRAFVRNSLLSESWGPEETSLAGFPFTAGCYFEMIVLCESQQFRVAVNGLHQLDYKHRVQDLSRLTLLEVLGDVTLLDVKML